MPNSSFLWLFVAVLIAAIAIVTVRLLRKRRHTWLRFARRYDLHWHDTDAHPRFTGNIDGRPFELSVADRGSDQGLLGVEVVEMKLGIATNVSSPFVIVSQDAVMTTIRQILGDTAVVPTGDERFDSLVCLRTRDPQQIVPALTDERRAAILQLLDRCPGCEIAITESAITLLQRRGNSSLRLLRQQLDALRFVADQLGIMGTATP